MSNKKQQLHCFKSKRMMSATAAAFISIITDWKDIDLTYYCIIYNIGNSNSIKKLGRRRLLCSTMIRHVLKQAALNLEAWKMYNLKAIYYASLIDK